MAQENKENTENLTLAEVKQQADKEQKNKQVKEGEKIQLIVFRLGTEEYALRIDQIKEVVITPGIAKIPQTPNYIKGVANIRGTISTIVDLEQRFGLVAETVSEERKAYTLVVENEEFRVGILVKEVPNTLTITSDDIDTDSGVLRFSAIKENCIKGIVHIGDRMIILIDLIQVLALSEIDELSDL